MDVTVFYSWQSDRPGEVCRHFIRDAAEEALRQIDVSATVDPSPRLDHDTKGESGMPEIAATILAKIERAGFFLADVTFVGVSENSASPKPMPNPNVLLELGFAARAIGWQRIICVMNEAFGPRDDQIFNIRHRRLPIGYSLESKAGREAVRPQLAARLKDAVSSLMLAEHGGLLDTIARLDVLCLVFLRQHANENSMVPPPTSRVVMGAPPGTLDTASYQHAVARLLDVGLIRCRIQAGTGELFYEWTYLGILVLRHLGWREASKGGHS